MGQESPGAGGVNATSAGAVLRGSVWNIASKIVPQFYLLVLSVTAARFLGPSDMGRQTFIAFVALSVTSISSGGLTDSMMRYIGELLGRDEPARARGLATWAWKLAAVGGLIGGASLATAGLLGADPKAAWVLAGVGCSLGIMQSIPSGILVGAQRWRDASIVGLVTGFVGVVATIVVLALGGGIVGLFAVEVVMAAFNMLWATALTRRTLDRMTHESVHDKQLVREAAQYAGWAALSIILTVVVFRRSEVFLIAHYGTDAEIAHYSIAFAVIYGLSRFAEALAYTLLPAFATLLGAERMDRIRSGFDRAERLLLLITIPLAGGVIALGPAAIEVAYGAEYAESGTVVAVMALGLPLLGLLSLSEALLLGLGRIRPLLAISSIAAVANLTLAFLLIPASGVVGAAIANVVGQAIAALAALRTARRLAPPEKRITEGRFLIANLVAAASGCAVAWGTAKALGPAGGLTLGAGGGLVVYLAVGSLLRAMQPEDAAWLRQHTAGTPAAVPVELACAALSRRHRMPK